MNVFLTCFIRNELEQGTNKSPENHFTVHAICLSRAPIHFQGPHKPRKKDTHSLIDRIRISYDIIWLDLKTNVVRGQGQYLVLRFNQS